MDKIYATVMLSDVLEDDERIRKTINEAIASGDVKEFKAYQNESQKSKDARVKNAQREGKEAEEYAKELGVHDKLFGGGKKKTKKDAEADLAALIRGNQAKRGMDFSDSLAAKYGAVPKAKGKKRAAEDDEEPDEEAFQAAAARLKKPKASSGRRGKKSKS
jgi:DnaJ family protein C protein 9